MGEHPESAQSDEMRSPARGRKALSAVGITLALALGLTAFGALTPTRAPLEAVPPVTATAQSASQDSVEALQQRLRAVPADWESWAALSLQYVNVVRTGGDPSLYDKAAAALERAQALKPGSSTVLLAEAVLAAARHQFPEAEVAARRALEVNPYSAPSLGVLIDALVEQGEYEEANQRALELVNLRPSVDGFARLSYLRELSGELPQAREHMERARSLSSADADIAFASFHIGELFLHEGKVSEAEAVWREAAARFPDDMLLQAALARAEAATSPERALERYERAAEKLPLPATLNELGELQLFLGDEEAARDTFRVLRAQVQIEASAGIDVDTELAQFEADHGDPKAALRFAEAAHQARPDAVIVSDTYAWSLHQVGRSEEALVHAKRAMRLGSENPALRYHLGVIAAAAGEAELARTTLTPLVETPGMLTPYHRERAAEVLAGL